MIAVLMLILTLWAVPASAQEQLLGRWVGMADQVPTKKDDKARPYAVELFLKHLGGSKQAGGSAYTSFQCAATIHYLYQIDGWTYLFEKKKKGKCPSGSIRVKLTDEGKLIWQWFLRYPEEPIAVAVLTRDGEETNHVDSPGSSSSGPQNPHHNASAGTPTRSGIDTSAGYRTASTQSATPRPAVHTASSPTAVSPTHAETASSAHSEPVRHDPAIPSLTAWMYAWSRELRPILDVLLWLAAAVWVIRFLWRKQSAKAKRGHA